MTYLQEDYRGLIIKIEHDEINESPDDWGNTDLFLTANHRQFWVSREGFNPQDINMEKVTKKYMVFPLIAYIHSGVALSRSRDGYPFNDSWDSCQVGFIFVEKKSFPQKNYGEAADSLLEEWNTYLSGNVWGYVIEDEDGDHIDSCWGFYGDPEDCMKEAKQAADAELRLEIKIQLEEMADKYSIYDLLEAVAEFSEQKADTTDLDVQLTWMEVAKKIRNCSSEIKTIGELI